MKRTSIDFSKHELIVDESEKISIFWLKKSDSIVFNIKFIITNGLTIVTGDFGNWMFNKEFYPNEDENVSDDYWVEKLQLYSTQKGKEFSIEETEKALKYEIKEGLEAYGYEGDELSGAKEFYKECLEHLESENEYSNFIYKWKPTFLDYEEIPYCKVINNRLQIIFDGFEEICRRLK